MRRQGLGTLPGAMLCKTLLLMGSGTPRNAGEIAVVSQGDSPTHRLGKHLDEPRLCSALINTIIKRMHSSPVCTYRARRCRWLRDQAHPHSASHPAWILGAWAKLRPREYCRDCPDLTLTPGRWKRGSGQRQPKPDPPLRAHGGWRCWWGSPGGLDPPQQDLAQHCAASQAGFFSLDLMGPERNRSKKGRTCKTQEERRRCHAYSLTTLSAPLQGLGAAPTPGDFGSPRRAGGQ